MPLDIQPLSPQRRATMLLVLFALFGGSLAFAHYLVRARTAPVPEVLTIIRPPDGMIEPVRSLESLEGVILSGAGNLEGRVRYFVAFSYEGNPTWTVDTAQAEALSLFQRVLNQPLENLRPAHEDGLVIRPATLGRMAGFDIQGEFGEGEERMFLLERMAAVPGRVIAICFSGPGPLTDADREFFDAFCNTRVAIRRVTPSPPA
jgi:hypothetical protein